MFNLKKIRLQRGILAIRYVKGYQVGDRAEFERVSEDTVRAWVLIIGK